MRWDLHDRIPVPVPEAHEGLRPPEQLGGRNPRVREPDHQEQQRDGADDVVEDFAPRGECCPLGERQQQVQVLLLPRLDHGLDVRPGKVYWSSRFAELARMFERSTK